MPQGDASVAPTKCVARMSASAIRGTAWRGSRPPNRGCVARRMPPPLTPPPACLNHVTPAGHPERPDRLRAIERALEQEKFQDLARVEAPAAELETIALCHPMDYVTGIRDATPKDSLVRLDADTSMSPGSFEAALRAAGGAVFAGGSVGAGQAREAFVATRPPGHHTETARPMGFCLFNNAAIAARHAQKRYGIEHVAIVDFDVHHGNGSQDIFWADPTVMYGSTHQMPLYPGTGAKNERGEHDTIVNAPLRPGDAGDHFREAFESVILPRLADFAPQLLIISAGFDAHMRDPLANLNLLEADFAWATRKLMDVAEKSAQGRVVSVLEGGYDLTALANSVAAPVAPLVQGGPSQPPMRGPRCVGARHASPLQTKTPPWDVLHPRPDMMRMGEVASPRRSHI